ncbi:MAG: N-acetylmuramoyl-L-alanine amidase [Eisenbergiella sp.]
MGQKTFRELLRLLTAVLFFTAVFFAGRPAAVLVDGDARGVRGDMYCVVIDSGHGGKDPGKIGLNGEKEKDINLAIARKLASLLEQADVKAVMTRTGDAGLYDEDASRKKVQDMKRRIERMEETAPDLVVSIHQNSYPDPSVKGAQVFYYTGSSEGRALAERIQNRLYRLDPSNRRAVKENNSYYLLKKTTCPIVIVECGFLSNPKEAEALSDAVYQEKAAWQICMGILQYLKAGK